MKTLLPLRKDKELYAELPPIFPMSLFHEDWAIKIHGQSLAQLNERGGLHPYEMVVNIKMFTARDCMDYVKNTNPEEVVKQLLQILKEHNNG